MRGKMLLLLRYNPIIIHHLHNGFTIVDRGIVTNNCIIGTSPPSIYMIRVSIIENQPYTVVDRSDNYNSKIVGNS